MGPNGAPFSPEEFAKYLSKIITTEVSERVGATVKQFLKEAPVKLYEVLRRTSAGQKTQQVSLPQALVELTDELKIDNELKRELINQNAALTQELSENRRIGSKILKRNRADED